MSNLVSYQNVYKNLLHNIPKSFLRFSTVIAENPHPTTNFMVDYLINRLGFSKEKATTASTDLTSIKSLKKPDSVLNFLKQTGLDDTQIKSLISWRPKLLASNVEKTLPPKIRVLQDLGLSGSDLTELILKNPYIFVRCVKSHITPSISFLQSVLQNDDDVIKILKKSKWVLSGQRKRMRSNLLVLQNSGVCDERIKKFIIKNPRYLMQKPNWIKNVIDLVEFKFGISSRSGMFLYAIDTIGSLSNSTLDSKIQIFESFGWTKSDIETAFRTLPYILGLSEGKIQKGLSFLMNELNYEPSYIAHRPKILMFNLETKVVPRHLVFNALKTKKLLNKNPSLYTVVCMTENKFLQSFVNPYKNEAPEVCEAYISSMEAATRSRK
ncbi:uncharacterized protein LOC143890715 [Tasmannia lanceolata]|uniref:uncharacterized protein LOC143890715 n=1 Tax=Tasmannia lanceolata TaxID=3420 RepID=UPI00406287A1